MSSELEITKVPPQKQQESGNKKIQWIMGLIANTIVLTYGMQNGWMSPTIPVLQGPDSPTGRPLSDYEISLVASAMSISAVFSCVVYSIVVDKFGRKIGLIAVSVPQILGWIIKLTSANPIVLIVSQICCGIAGGGVFSVSPLYTKEISEDSIRGAMGSVGMLMQSIGILLMYVIGAYLKYHVVVWIAIWIPVLNTLLLIFLAPESPPYLVKKGKIEEAKKTIAYLMGRDTEDKAVQAALSKFCKDQEQFEKLPPVSVKTIFKEKATRRAFFLGLLMITMLDIGGNFAIFSYASVIIRDSGITIEPDLQAISFPAVMIVGSMISTITVEKFGRKPLLISSMVLNGSPMIVLGTYLLLQQHGYSLPAVIPVLSVVLSVFAYGVGILPVPYIVMSEIFSFQMRAKILGAYVTYGWFLCFLQTITFTPISTHLGMHTVFYMYGALNAFGVVVCTLFMPETKGKTVEQIHMKLVKK